MRIAAKGKGAHSASHLPDLLRRSRSAAASFSRSRFVASFCFCYFTPKQKGRMAHLTRGGDALLWEPGNKQLLSTWRLECELGIKIDPDCPIDGGWSPWTPWSACHGACDTVGHRKRLRKCNNPPPSKEGLSCSGLDEQIESCYLKNCSVDDYRTIVEGDVARAEALHQLEVIPAFMERCLQMECPYEAVEAALTAENTWQLHSEALWNALQCVKHDIGCSVKGEWGSWGPWSACGAQCGKGLRWRTRVCDNPPPSVSHLVCLGAPLQNKECEGDQCAIDEQHSELRVSGTWSEWGEWTKCSEKCGTGIRRRKRTCIEKHILIADIAWKTHCRGQYEEVESCNIKKCLLNGGWSGWGAWGPCSQSCGAGKRSRTRSCTRPIPSDGGTNCVGPKVDVGSCHLTPCEVYSHIISVFNGDSVLQYDFPKKRSTFFHFYIRFMPLSPHGTIIRRGTIQNSRLRVSLHKWHICYDAHGTSKTCALPRTCSPSALEPSVWHSIMITVSNKAVTIRVNDAQIPIRSAFPCDPELSSDKIKVFVGEKFHGVIQESILNFRPISMFIERERQPCRTDLVPISASNIAYENANIEEAYIHLESEQYLRLPCFKVQDDWQLELTVKSKSDSGMLLFFKDYKRNSWFYMMLQSMRLIIKFTADEFKSEAISSTECLPNQWLDIKLTKRKETNTIEVSINTGERLHVLLADDKFRKLQVSKNKYSNVTQHSSVINTNQSSCGAPSNKIQDILCSNEYFIGGIPLPITNKISEEFTPFFGIIASLKINNNLLDLHTMNMERYKDGIIQLSSRTASISGSYHETHWDESNQLNLTCVHARLTRSPYPAYWLYLDSVIENKNKSSMDDGRVLRLIITAKNPPGFYTCRGSDNERTKNFLTYGILGKSHYKLLGPDTLTVIALCTTVALVLFTLGWLIIEGYNDARDGYGFFRDDQLSTEDQTEIASNQHMHVCGTENIIARSNTRRRNRHLRDQAMLESHKKLSMFHDEQSHEYTLSEPEELPALPEVKSTAIKPACEIYRSEQICSPLHSSNITSLKTELSPSSTNISPRIFYSRLLFTNSKNPTKGNSNKKTICSSNFEVENRPKLLTIQSSSFVHSSSVQKVLKKFKDLKSTES
ncbi:uncharacterized protein LOC126780655 [Nymphalis io]|uniref:uncharacterized protein LOC126780655 n=1 Tax=Inachis io TaxID=171585 RepID=UPI0021675169|nr:uncharacterized protein LOC126780655 [Nymphalis io]